MGTVDDWLLTQLRSKFFSYELTSVYLYLVSLKRWTGFMKMVNTFIKTVDLNYFKYSLMGFTKTNVHRSSNSNFKKKVTISTTSLMMQSVRQCIFLIKKLMLCKI